MLASFSSRALAIAAALAAAFGTALAQAPFKGSSYLNTPQMGMPAHGPSSFWSNPAALAGTHWGSLALAYTHGVSGKGGARLLSATGALPIEALPRWPLGMAIGYASWTKGAAIDGSNAVYLEGESRLSASFSYPSRPDRRFTVAAGISGTESRFNAFGAVRSTSNGMDLGLHSAFSAPAGAFRAGTTLHHFLRPGAMLPSDNPSLIQGVYYPRRWWGQDFGWTSAGGRWRADLGFYLPGPHDPAEGPDWEPFIGVNGWEFEAKPIPELGIRIDRPRNGAWSTLSLVGYRSVGRADLSAALGFGHDKYDPETWFPFGAFTRTFFGEAADEGRGFLITLSAGAGI